MMADMRRPQLFASLHGYQRSWLRADMMAGLTLLAIAVPQQLATSRLADMPPVTGFYAFVAGTVLFAALGASRHMSVGADSTIAPLFAAGVSALALAGSPHYVELVGILAVMVGIIVMLVSILRLGWLAEFLSTPIVTGFLSGVALIIIAHQLPEFFGIPAVTGTNQHRVGYVLTHLNEVNGWSLAIGIGVLVLLIACSRLHRGIPAGLIGLVGSMVLVGVFHLEAHGVSVLGQVSTGVPHVGLTGLSWSTVRRLAPLSAVVALVVVIQTAATTSAFAEQDRPGVDAGRNFLGVGAGSIVAGLVGSFPVDASPPNTGAVTSVGGRTQAGALGAAAVILLLIPFAGVFRYVPLATLAAILIFVALRLFRVRDMVAIARFNLLEFALAAITLLTVALVGVEQGIAVAVVLAILDRIRLSARPQLHVLGLLPGTTSWAPLSAEPSATELPSVLVLLFATPLWYANAVHFRDEATAALSRNPGTKILVLDALGMSDVDFTGSRELSHVLDACDRAHVAFGIARTGDHLEAMLQRGGLTQRIGPSHFYPSVNEAVTALTDTPSPPT
jgi:sulfate permease, SulP family